MEELTEEDRRALRGSKFAPLPPRSSEHSRISRLAHPGGPLTTNKAAALAKFLERKLKKPGSSNSLDPEIVERAVRNAQAAVNPAKYEAGSSRLQIRHVDSFSDEVTPPSSPEKKKKKDKLKTVVKSNGGEIKKTKNKMMTKKKKKLVREKKKKKKQNLNK